LPLKNGRTLPGAGSLAQAANAESRGGPALSPQIA
jgi:hypothetical protein